MTSAYSCPARGPAPSRTGIPRLRLRAMRNAEPKMNRDKPQMNTDGHRWGTDRFLQSVFVCVHLWLIYLASSAWSAPAEKGRMVIEATEIARHAPEAPPGWRAAAQRDEI